MRISLLLALRLDPVIDFQGHFDDWKHWWSRGHAPGESRCDLGSGVWRQSGGSAVTTDDRGTS
jgi:hypothetical protein